MHIPVMLTHPEVLGPPLERGVRYGHHFVVELISDGKRLWATASEEGKKIIHEIEHGISGEEPKAVSALERRPADIGPTVAEWVAAGYSAKNYPPSPYASRSTPEEIAAAIEAEAAGNQSGTFRTTSPPLPNRSGSGGEPPTTTTAPANSFDS